MLDIILKIITIIGVILLILLLVFLILLLLVLFMPMVYKIFGKKNPEETTVRIKANWLFGLLRIRYSYPEPGNVIVKVLWITVYNSSKAHNAKEHAKSKENPKSEADKRVSTTAASERQPEENLSKANDVTDSERKFERIELSEIDGIATEKLSDQGAPGTTSEKDSHIDMDGKDYERKTILDRILSKFEKIKYTFIKLYDKIKHIIENISFYKELFQDSQTQELLHHGMFRIGRVLKSIRPRTLKGNILFGTGSPDTTGYAFGIYSMASVWLGNAICVTPDFTQAILEGEIYAAGHITVFQLLWHSIRVLLDKRLRLLIHRIKTHKL